MHEDSDALHERARAFVHAFESGADPPEPFEELARALARHQAARVPGYARLLAARGVDLDSVDVVTRAPAVPTEAFKLARVAAFPPGGARAVFHTSGTTIGQHGVHEMRRPETYDAAALAFGKQALARGLARPPSVLVLGPTPDEAPHSSLTRMLALFARTLGRTPLPDGPFFVNDGIIDVERLDREIARATVEDDPVLLLGTSFAFVHFLDALEDAPFPLPRGSRVMLTGGFKGRSREVEAGELRAHLAQAFAVPVRDIVGEYGMTELSSQFYESRTLPAGTYVEPPWARVLPVDPETLEPVTDGELGIARVVDLMNVDSAFAVLAADRVRRVPGGFELLGRWPGAMPRGCSIGVDDLLRGRG